MTVDEKYVVWKRPDWDNFANWFNAGMPGEEDQWAEEVPDAVVIRKQDIFAGPALHAYASSIQTAIELIGRTFVGDVGDNAMKVKRLEEIRDYFFAQAMEADDIQTKKVPD